MLDDQDNEGTNPFGGPAQSVDLNDNPRYTIPKFSPPPIPSAPSLPPDASHLQFSWEMVWKDSAESIFNLNAPFRITVSSPEVVNPGSMMTKHIEYTVRTEPMGYTVRRRFNDFAWLREALTGQYAGLFIPTLPVTTKIRGMTQRITGEQTDVNGEFVRNRLEALNKFAGLLSANPFVRTAPALFAFLSVFKEKEWKSIVESNAPVEEQEAFQSLRNDGLDRWNEMLDNFFINQTDAFHKCNEFRQQMEIALKSLESLEREAKATGRKAMQFVYSANLLQEQFLLWQKAENDLLDPNMNQLLNPHGNRVRILMTNLTLGQLQWTSNMAMMPQILGRVILKNVQNQILEVEQFIQHLVLREIALKDLERAEKERVKALEEKNRAEAAASTGAKRSMFSKPYEQLEEIYNKKSEQVQRLQRTTERMTKAFIFSEIDRFSRDRVGLMHNLVGGLSVTNLEVASTCQKRWTDVVVNAAIETDQFVEYVEMLRSNLDLNDMFTETQANN